MDLTPSSASTSEQGGKAGATRGKRARSVRSALTATTHHATAWIPKLHFRTYTEDDGSNWWFAGTAGPLLAATLGPTANVCSIAALVTSWRLCLVPDIDSEICSYNGNATALLPPLSGNPYHDPGWAYHPNIVSLVFGCVGNLFLLFNFTGFIRYKISLPVTIVSWFIATGILIGITASMHIHVPPQAPYQTYSQGFWYGILAAIHYLVAAGILMVNMVGYYLGHFPEHFNLTPSQRTLINQSMMFFVWMAAGGEVFSVIERRYGSEPQEWAYVNGLYFCDVTILTVGFGDIVPTSTLGRALVFPYAIIGITMLGLIISSISKFAKEIGSANIIRKHYERSRARTFERSEKAAQQELQQGRRGSSRRRSSVASRDISGPTHAVDVGKTTRIPSTPSAPLSEQPTRLPDEPSAGTPFGPLAEQPTEPATPSETPFKLNKTTSFIQFASQTRKTLMRRQTTQHKKHNKKQHKDHDRLVLLKEERARFNTMRRLQRSTLRYKRWMSLILSLFCFAVLWLVGALVFFYAEEFDWTYGDALYFGYISLLTIGYGDFSPSTNISRPVFVVWSVVAVPTMTILFGALSSTLVTSFEDSINKIAEVTYMPRMGLFKEIRDHSPLYNHVYLPIRNHFRREKEARELDERLRQGFQVGIDEEAAHPSKPSKAPPRQTPEEEKKLQTEILDLEHLARRALDGKHPWTELILARRLATAIQQVAADQRADSPRKYTYEEWLTFTQLIRFTNYNTTRGKEPKHRHHGGDDDDLETAIEESNELIEWDWIGENSPLMAHQKEPEFVLDRLCESMNRFLRHKAAQAEVRTAKHGAHPIYVAEEDENAHELERAMLRGLDEEREGPHDGHAMHEHQHVAPHEHVETHEHHARHGHHDDLERLRTLHEGYAHREGHEIPHEARESHSAGSTAVEPEPEPPTPVREI